MHLGRRTTITAISLYGFAVAALVVSGCDSKKNTTDPVVAATPSVVSNPPKAGPSLPEPSALGKTDTPATAASPAGSAAAAAAADYSLEGIGTLSENCVDPNVVLSAVPKNYYESNTFDWRHIRQVALANTGFHVLPALGTAKAEGSIAFTENEHKPTKGVALVLHCATPKTCLRFAAAYRTVVPDATVTPICGSNPNLGPRVMGGKSVLPSSGNLKEVLPEKTDVQSQCVRLAACKAARVFKLDGNPSQECMKKPSSFKVSCSLKKTCEQVLACSEG
jgi:hypothetical protein